MPNLQYVGGVASCFVATTAVIVMRVSPWAPASMVIQSAATIDLVWFLLVGAIVAIVGIVGIDGTVGGRRRGFGCGCRCGCRRGGA